MSVAALLLVSAFSLLVCYYVLAWFGHMGNFMNLPLPGLPPPKAAPATVSHAAMIACRGVAGRSIECRSVECDARVGQWLAHWR